MKSRTTDQKPPNVATWLAITLLWGTVFYWTSISMLQLASAKLGEGTLAASTSQLWSVYGVHAGVLIVFALTAMAIKGIIDPGNKKQLQRKQNISEGKGEKIFISFAGSIATSFFFTTLTSLTLLGAAGFFNVTVTLTLQMVLLAALFNIAAGLAASLFVGILFLIGKVGQKKS